MDRTCAVAFSTLSILSAEILHRARLDLSLHLRSQTCQQDKPPEHYLAVRVMVRSPSTLVSSLGPARPRPQMCWPLPTDPARDHVRSSVRPCLPLPSRLCAIHWSLTPCARVVCASLAGFAAHLYDLDRPCACLGASSIVVLVHGAGKRAGRVHSARKPRDSLLHLFEIRHRLGVDVLHLSLEGTKNVGHFHL